MSIISASMRGSGVGVTVGVAVGYMAGTSITGAGCATLPSNLPLFASLVPITTNTAPGDPSEITKPLAANSSLLSGSIALNQSSRSPTSASVAFHSNSTLVTAPEGMNTSDDSASISGLGFSSLETRYSWTWMDPSVSPTLVTLARIVTGTPITQSSGESGASVISI